MGFSKQNASPFTPWKDPQGDKRLSRTDLEARLRGSQGLRAPEVYAGHFITSYYTAITVKRAGARARALGTTCRGIAGEKKIEEGEGGREGELKKKKLQMRYKSNGNGNVLSERIGATHRAEFTMQTSAYK